MERSIPLGKYRHNDAAAATIADGQRLVNSKSRDVVHVLATPVVLVRYCGKPEASFAKFGRLSVGAALADLSIGKVSDCELTIAILNPVLGNCLVDRVWNIRSESS